MTFQMPTIQESVTASCGHKVTAASFSEDMAQQARDLAVYRARKCPACANKRARRQSALINRSTVNYR